MKKVLFVAISLLIISSSTQARQVSRAEFVENLNILFLKGNYAGLIKNAESHLRYSRLSRNEKKEVLCLMGISYIKLGNFAEARKAFDEILAMKGDEFRQDAYIGIADSYLYEKRFEKAIKSYQAILNMYPRTERISTIYYNLGRCYKAKEDVDKANSYFQKVKKYYKTSFEADKVTYLPSKTSPNYYIIQLGAFRRLRNAKKLVKRLSRKGYDSYIQKVKKEGNILYRVRGGKFSNKYYAVKLAGKLKKDRFSPKIIVE